MISSKENLKYYLQRDRLMNGFSKQRKFFEIIKDFFFPSNITFLRYLRKVEYYKNMKIRGIIPLYYTYKFRSTSRKLGYTIGLNTCGAGLSLPHYGTIIISAEAKLGENCRVHTCVNIGRSGGEKMAPQIGDNVYIGPSCVLFGNISIASNVTIGANATVNKSFKQEHVVIAGSPAQIVKTNYPNWMEFNKLIV